MAWDEASSSSSSASSFSSSSEVAEDVVRSPGGLSLDRSSSVLRMLWGAQKREANQANRRARAQSAVFSLSRDRGRGKGVGGESPSLSSARTQGVSKKGRTKTKRRTSGAVTARGRGHTRSASDVTRLATLAAPARLKKKKKKAANGKESRVKKKGTVIPLGRIKSSKKAKGKELRASRVPSTPLTSRPSRAGRAEREAGKGPDAAAKQRVRASRMRNSSLPSSMRLGNLPPEVLALIEEKTGITVERDDDVSEDATVERRPHKTKKKRVKTKASVTKAKSKSKRTASKEKTGKAALKKKSKKTVSTMIPTAATRKKKKKTTTTKTKTKKKKVGVEKHRLFEDGKTLNKKKKTKTKPPKRRASVDAGARRGHVRTTSSDSFPSPSPSSRMESHAEARRRRHVLAKARAQRRSYESRTLELSSLGSLSPQRAKHRGRASSVLTPSSTSTSASASKKSTAFSKARERRLRRASMSATVASSSPSKRRAATRRTKPGRHSLEALRPRGTSGELPAADGRRLKMAWLQKKGIPGDARRSAAAPAWKPRSSSPDSDDESSEEEDTDEEGSEEEDEEDTEEEDEEEEEEAVEEKKKHGKKEMATAGSAVMRTPNGRSMGSPAKKKAETPEERRQRKLAAFVKMQQAPAASPSPKKKKSSALMMKIKMQIRKNQLRREQARKKSGSNGESVSNGSAGRTGVSATSSASPKAATPRRAGDCEAAPQVVRSARTASVGASGVGITMGWDSLQKLGSASGGKVRLDVSADDLDEMQEEAPRQAAAGGEQKMQGATAARAAAAPLETLDEVRRRHARTRSRLARAASLPAAPLALRKSLSIPQVKEELSRNAHAREHISALRSVVKKRAAHLNNPAAKEVAQRMKELQAAEVGDWILRVLRGGKANDHEQTTDIASPQAFLDFIASGVRLCQLLQKIVPPGHSIAKRCSFHKSAKPGTFLARDNLAQFLSAAELLGVPRLRLFESDDVLDISRLRKIVSCLLHVARCAAVYGVEPPEIVKIEQEIDEDATGSDVEVDFDVDVGSEAAAGSETEQSTDGKVARVIQELNDGGEEQFFVRKTKKRKGTYKIRLKAAAAAAGGRKQKPLVMKRVRGMLMVRVGGGWESFERWALRRKTNTRPKKLALSQSERSLDTSVDRRRSHTISSLGKHRGAPGEKRSLARVRASRARSQSMKAVVQGTDIRDLLAKMRAAKQSQ